MERFLPRLRMPLAGLWTTLLFLFVSLATMAQQPFITTWKTNNPGESITIPVNPDVLGYNYTVNWGDGNTSTVQTGDASHTYGAAGTYTVSITGDFPAIHLGLNGIDVTDKLMSVEQWGDMPWASMERAFQGASNMVLNATDVPNLSGVLSLARMFDGASSLNSDLSGWNVSSVTDMSLMFNGASAFNGNISGWNVSNVTNMYGMFWYAGDFNQDIGGWNVSQVADMSYMFYSAADFNQDLSGWVTSNVTNMEGMFSFILGFDQSLGNWDISGVTTMKDMLLATGLSPENYSATLIGWAPRSVQSGVTLDAPSLTYCPGTNVANAIQQLESKGWTINDAGEAADCDGGDIGPADPDHFITVWNTEIDAGTGPYDIKIPATGEFTYTWVDINNPTATGSGNGSDETIITFPQPGTYEVRMAPTGSTPFHSIRLHYRLVGNDAAKLLEVRNWGTVHWSKFVFYGCENLKVTATDIPDLSGVTDLSFAFSLSGIDVIPNINDWDVSTVTNLSNLFEDVAGFNQSLDNWDVSNVTNMSFMFDGATSFNQSLDSWDVRKLEDISYMFRDASSFNQSLAAWQLESFVGGIASFYMSGMSCENFSYSLYSWATNPNTNDGAILGGSGVTYSPDVASYVDKLRDERNWHFQLLQEGTCSVVLPDTPIEPDDNNILYVNINVGNDAPGGNGSGDSWENAIPELADALKWAREQHDGGSPGWSETEPLRIFVAEGSYKPLYNADDGQYMNDGGRDNSFVLVANVQLYGGFDPIAGVETLDDVRILPSINALGAGTILSGDFNGNDNTDNFDNHIENAYHVVIGSGGMGSALVDGFAVTGGYASGATSGVSVAGRTIYRFFGGGTYLVSTSPKLTHMVWFNNYGEWGGGLYNTVTSLLESISPTLKNVTFYRNRAPGGGGGIRNFGGSLEIVQATFAYNGAGFVEDPTSSGPGGGIYSSGSGTSLSVTNATFYRNWIVGAFIPNLDGGAMQVEETSTLLSNVVIWENEVEGNPTVPTASISSRDAQITITNSLVAQSGGSENWEDDIGVDGGGNIDADPVFVSTTPGEAGFLQLSACSPAVSAGSNQVYTDAGGDLANDLDMAGNSRVYNLTGGGVIDMGAYEYQGERAFVQSLAMPDAVQVAYGTALEDVEDLPATVTATLSDDTDISIPLDGNLANWTLASPMGGAYDGDVAGAYVFTVPLLIPETECYLNPENLQAEVTIVVEKGMPLLTALWNGTPIDLAEGFSLTYGNVGELALSTTDTDGELTYAFGDDDVQVLDLADLDAVAAQQVGTATLTIAQEETDNYEAASVEIAVTVVPKAITVVAEPDQGKVYGVNEPATYGYGLANADALAFDDELMDIVSAVSREAGEDVGAYDIQLVFGGNQAGNYTITFEADNNAFTVTPLIITVTATDKSKVFGFDDPALTYTFVPELIGDDVFTGGLDRAEGENVGSYAITQGNLALGANYEITFEPGTLTITPAAYEGLEFNNGSFVYNGAEHVLELTGELPEGVTVTYEIDSQAGNGATDAGAYEITALIDGGNNYEDTELTAMLTITPLEITVTAADKTKAFGSDDPALTYTFSPELVGNDAFTGELDREVGEDVGTYNITQGNLVLGDNYEISFEEGTFTITPAAYEGVEFNNGSFVYDGVEHVLELTGELPEGATVTYGIQGEAGNGATDAGAYEITALIDGGNNYEDLELTATLTITPLEITVTAADKTKAFGSDDPALTYTFAPELIGEDVFTGGLDREVGEDVGTYNITQGNLVLGDNYEISFEEGTFTITPAAYEGVEFNSGSFVYNGAEHVLELTGELPEGATVAYEIDGEAGNGATDVGTYEVIAYVDGGANYGDGELTATLTITPAAISGIILNNTSSTYDGTEHRLSLAGDLPAGASVTYEIDSEPGNDATDAGTYEVIAYIDGGANYEDVELTARLTITPLGITVSASDQTKAFGTDDPALTYTFTPALIGEDVFDGSLARDEGEAVGNYTITQGDLALGGNYSIDFEAGELTITPRQLSEIVFENTSFTYDGTEHTLTLAGDLPAGASVTYENNGRTTVGNQTVRAVIDGGGNYQDEVLDAILTVVPAARTLDFPALPEKTYGDAGFDAKATASSGEVISYTSSNPDVAEVSADGEITITGAGETTITATVPENANYSSRPQVSQPLTVEKATQTITLDGPAEANRDVGSIELTASSTSGLPVVLTADNNEVATLDGTTLSILRLGRVTITAAQAGDANHEAAEPVTLTIRVIDPTSDLPVRVHPVISPNGDGINEFLMIEAIKDYPENRVTIFNRNGTLLWEASGYDNNRVTFRGISTGQQLLPAGTYFYIVEVKDGNTWKHKKGYFVLRY